MYGEKRVDDSLVNEYLMQRDSQNNAASEYKSAGQSAKPDFNFSQVNQQNSGPGTKSPHADLIGVAQRTVAHRQALQMQQSPSVQYDLGQQAFSPEI